ncbi:hypothetical protein [Sphingomonas jaspsi]|uniref:hypothetical protein n=1 Tax=Sphingomonas jaspsi TaxID=392409 RepID=UPI0004BA05D3|nr:hypothetical protein [Sphingomonas jaspsi]
MSAPKKNAFMLSSATLMMCRYGDTPVFDLTPALHGVGLSEEIAVNLDSSNVDLTAGIAQAIVDSQRVNVQAGITGTVKEYSPENLLRAQGLATGAVTTLRGKLTAPAAAAAVSLSVATDPIPGDPSSDMGTAAAAVKAGSVVLIQDPATPELVFPARVKADSTYAAGVHTISIADTPLPAGMSFPVDAKIWVVTEMAVGAMGNTDLFSVKIVGTLSNFNRPIVAVFPKVQVTKGFNLTFSEKEYGTMPWEMRPLLLSASEATGRLAEIGTKAPGKVYAA